ncbi:MAG: QueT transporter family protein [Clostridiales bacterium]|nr:QueT transporter family protein [Clostridiales bacterium]
MSNEALKTASQKRRQSTLFICQAGIIAALYVALTFVFAPISFGAVQVRIAEALTILPIFTPAAIPGLFVGCLIGNFLGGGIILDIIFGSIATLLGAIGTYLLRKKNPIFGTIPPIVANTLIVPFVIKYAYANETALPLIMLMILGGEVLSCGVLGGMLGLSLKKTKLAFSKEKKEK